MSRPAIFTSTMAAALIASLLLVSLLALAGCNQAPAPTANLNLPSLSRVSQTALTDTGELPPLPADPNEEANPVVRVRLYSAWLDKYATLRARYRVLRSYYLALHAAEDKSKQIVAAKRGGSVPAPEPQAKQKAKPEPVKTSGADETVRATRVARVAP